VKGVKSINSLDKQATKSSFLTALQSNENGAVMIATHAANDNEDPYLLFDAKNTAHSKLFASEIRHYKVSCPLVVLSACATHQGKTYEGLGTMSFAKTIEWAGGSSVAATLWEVDDQSMSVLTSLFYKFLAEGLPKDVAMQNAKLAYLKTSTGKANDLPFYWAHFQVIGDTEPLSEPTNYLLLYLSAVFISLLFLYFFRLKIKIRN
jgi:CHAT domain-containing protein